MGRLRRVYAVSYPFVRVRLVSELYHGSARLFNLRECLACSSLKERSEMHSSLSHADTGFSVFIRLKACHREKLGGIHYLKTYRCIFYRISVLIKNGYRKVLRNQITPALI